MSPKTAKETINDALNKLGDSHPPEVKEKIRKLTEDIYVERKTPQDAMGLNPQMVESMYGFAYRLYGLGKYDQAAQLFRILIMMNPMEMRFLLGVSACYHMLKLYDQAATSYMLCSLVNPVDPLPYYHASDCFIALEDFDMAEKALKLCIAYCEEREEYKQMKERAEVSLKAVTEKKKEKKAAEEKPPEKMKKSA